PVAGVQAGAAVLRGDGALRRGVPGLQRALDDRAGADAGARDAEGARVHAGHDRAFGRPGGGAPRGLRLRAGRALRVRDGEGARLPLRAGVPVRDHDAHPLPLRPRLRRLRRDGRHGHSRPPPGAAGRQGEPRRSDALALGRRRPEQGPGSRARAGAGPDGRRGALDLLPREESLREPRRPRLRLGHRGRHRGLPRGVAPDPGPRQPPRRTLLPGPPPPVRGGGTDGGGERDQEPGADRPHRLGAHGRHLARGGVLGARGEPTRLDPVLPRRLSGQRLRRPANPADLRRGLLGESAPGDQGDRRRRADDEHRLDLPTQRRAGGHRLRGGRELPRDLPHGLRPRIQHPARRLRQARRGRRPDRQAAGGVPRTPGGRRHRPAGTEGNETIPRRGHLGERPRRRRVWYLPLQTGPRHGFQRDRGRVPRRKGRARLRPGGAVPGNRGGLERLPAVHALLKRRVEGAHRGGLQPPVRLLLRHHGRLGGRLRVRGRQHAVHERLRADAGDRHLAGHRDDAVAGRATHHRRGGGHQPHRMPRRGRPRLLARLPVRPGFRRGRVRDRVLLPEASGARRPLLRPLYRHLRRPPPRPLRSEKGYRRGRRLRM
ncbi:MAG: ABC transporter, fused permease protein, partial [uncultured Rubrobacteraceae bacterium]